MKIKILCDLSPNDNSISKISGDIRSELEKTREKMAELKQNRRIGRECKYRKGTHTGSRRGACRRDSGRKAEVGSPLRFAGTCT